MDERGRAKPLTTPPAERETFLPPQPVSGIFTKLPAGPLTGKVLLDRYELGGLLGEGGSASVYDATHLWTRRRVAVKLLAPRQHVSPQRLRRAVTEARTLATLDHPNVVAVLDMEFDETAGPILVLERLHGELLSRCVSVRAPLSVSATLGIVVPIADALAVAHEAEIVHRDIKPENIMLSVSPRGTVPKLLDFGIAKVFADARTLEPSTPRSSIVGTPAYMAPEQITGREAISPAVDVWALGVVLYECLSGALPFHASTIPELLSAITYGQFIPLREQPRAHDVDPRVAAAVERALEVDPRDRYPDARTFVRVLDKLW